MTGLLELLIYLRPIEFLLTCFNYSCWEGALQTLDHFQPPKYFQVSVHLFSLVVLQINHSSSKLSPCSLDSLEHCYASLTGIGHEYRRLFLLFYKCF